MSKRKYKPDMYFSADVEADGPIPGQYSMISFGLCVAATFDGEQFSPRDPSSQVFYKELQPISHRFDPEALAVSGLDRDKLYETGWHAVDAMYAASEWVSQQAVGFNPVLTAYPLSFDWLFLYWYWINFTGSCPFGFSGTYDMKTAYAAKAGVVYNRVNKRNMPDHLRSGRKHTHNALDDAIEQADLFNNMFVWNGDRSVDV